MTAPNLPPRNRAEWARDVRAVIAAYEVTPGLPCPSITEGLAAFSFADLTDAKDARWGVAWAETILSHALQVEFKRPEKGAGRYFILAAKMPSGLRVHIVALASHYADVPAEREPELTGTRSAA